MTQELLILIIIASIVICLGIGYFAYYLIKNYLTKAISFDATISNKYCNERNITGQASNTFIYYVCFKDNSNNSEIKFQVDDYFYRKAIVGTSGKLSYKGTRIVNFEVRES